MPPSWYLVFVAKTSLTRIHAFDFHITLSNISRLAKQRNFIFTLTFTFNFNFNFKVQNLKSWDFPFLIQFGRGFQLLLSSKPDTHFETNTASSNLFLPPLAASASRKAGLQAQIDRSCYSEVCLPASLRTSLGLLVASSFLLSSSSPKTLHSSNFLPATFELIFRYRFRLWSWFSFRFRFWFWFQTWAQVIFNPAPIGNRIFPYNSIGIRMFTIRSILLFPIQFLVSIFVASHHSNRDKEPQIHATTTCM